MNEIGYVRPTSLADACAALAEPGARALAGGTDLIVQLRERGREAARLVDLKFVEELTGINEEADGTLVLGAAATATRLAGDERVRIRYPALWTALGMIGSRQVQNRASLGGNICNAAPSADAVPPLICYRTQCVIASDGGTRQSPLDEIFARPGRTHLAQGEILVALRLPPPPPRSAGHYIRFTPRREMDIAVAGVGSWIACGDDGTIADARVVLASVAPTPLRAPGAEAALHGQRPTPEAFAQAAAATEHDASPISDTRGSAAFRRKLVHTLTQRTLAACAATITAQ